MTQTYTLPEFMEREVMMLVKSRHYSTRIDVLKDALRALFATKPNLKILVALQMYLNNNVLPRGAEIAGVTTVKFKEIIANKGITRVSESKSTKDMDEKANSYNKFIKNL